MFCQSCGAENTQGASFCCGCGAPLQPSTPETCIAPAPAETTDNTQNQPKAVRVLNTVFGYVSMGMGIASAVIALALFLWCCPYTWGFAIIATVFALFFSITGLGLGIASLVMAKKLGEKNKFATIGVIFSAIVMGLPLVFLVLALVFAVVCVIIYIVFIFLAFIASAASY